MAHILIIEDDLDIQNLLKNFLQEVGYKTTIASDGIEAISFFLLPTLIWSYWISCYLKLMGLQYAN